MPTDPPFDPENDWPPHGAYIRDGQHEVTFDGNTGFWTVTAGPDVGSIARPFDVNGIWCAKRWAKNRPVKARVSADTGVTDK